MRLPKSVQPIADVIGVWKALRLVRALPPTGKRDRRRDLYIPYAENLTDDHRLVQLLGWDDAVALSKGLPGHRFQPATCRYVERGVQNRRIFDMQDLAYFNSEIAHHLGLSLKWVEKVTHARYLHAQGVDVADIAQVVGINQLMLGYMLGVDVPDPEEPVKRRPNTRRSDQVQEA